MSGLTDEAKDVSDGGYEDDQHVVEDEDEHGDQEVPGPAEFPAAEEQRGDGGADLRGHKAHTFRCYAGLQHLE